MSQLADIEQVVSSQPMEEKERASLFLDLLQALNWEIDGVNTVEDAILYLRGFR